MRTVKFRIHFKSGLSIDVEQETEFDTYTEIWQEIMNFANGKPQGSRNFYCGNSGKKFYMYLVDDIVCFETL